MPLLYNGQEIGDTSPQSIYARWPVGWQAACLPKPAKKLEFHKKLCQLRRNERALGEGQTVWLDNDRPDWVLSFCRRAGSDEIVSVVNLSNRSVKVQVGLPAGQAGSYLPLLADKAGAKSAGGKLVLDLQGFGYFVGKRQ